MKKIILVLILILVGLGFFSFKANAVGLGVKPTAIKMAIKIFTKTQTEILVGNVSGAPALYQIYPDDFEKTIRVFPDNFRLEVDGSQLVKVEIKPKFFGEIKTNLSVVARPLSAGGLITGSGVKIPVEIKVLNWPWWLWVMIGLFLVCLVWFFVVKLKKRKIYEQSKNH